MTDVLFKTLRRIADPATSRDAAYTLCAQAIPNGLFTAMRLHAATMEVERLFSTLPDSYPVSGRKPKRDTAWGDKVLVRRQVNIGSGANDIVWAFSDHETILALGLTEVLNVPVLRGARVMGTINFLRAAPAFSEDDAATGQILAAALALRG
ncbi:GAF domain-containing protein [Roseovarius tibetensis]|uniref:GAF domain-containing protein n=1 Tax=Roseovarius tibetensis TaxID=2685897 RepID=UPI003D7F9351